MKKNGGFALNVANFDRDDDMNFGRYSETVLVSEEGKLSILSAKPNRCVKSMSHKAESSEECISISISMHFVFRICNYF